MIVVQIVGGLGNQMFGYAYAKKLQNLGYEVCLDCSHFKHNSAHGGLWLDAFNTNLPQFKRNFINKIRMKIYKKSLFGYKKMAEKSLEFDPALLSPPKNARITGYFQNEKYFSDIRGELLADFFLKATLDEYSRQILSQIQNAQNPVSIHVRRGDYINEKNAKTHGFCGLDYYKKAIAHIRQNRQNPQFFVFSEETEWCRENLGLENAVYVQREIDSMPNADIFLMSQCRDNVIANSTFSWWGAWLNEREDKIITAPHFWAASERINHELRDIIPKEWMRF